MDVESTPGVHAETQAAIKPSIRFGLRRALIVIEWVELSEERYADNAIRGE
ncbi:MAG: hypothetical protein KJO95_09250 [Gammaproteobacteria bacterium]|nr:hypothetical protein [Gammaproteobacteria bacterium]MBU2677717.1 hypothetical protein [Gammaproteobacteria bacterium]